MAISRADPAHGRYLRRMLITSATYIAAVAGASLLIPEHAPANARTIAIALVPGLAVLAWIWAMARLLIELSDEYLRLLEVRKFLIATGVTLAGTSIWGMVELFADVPRLPVFFVFPIWCAALVIGQIANMRSLGASGCA